MIPAENPNNEQDRLRELLRYEVLHTQYEEDFDQIVQLASSICKTPISTITLLDIHQQWFKAKIGIDKASDDRSISFCGHAIHQTDIMEVEDALNDIRFFDNPLVLGDPNIRFYAGYPLISPSGYPLGTLCVIDKIPRTLTEEQKFALRTLGNQTMKMFELRLKNKEEVLRNQVIEEQKKKLEISKAIQNKIISIIAHDVRGPVASVKSMIELSNDQELAKQDQEELLRLLDKQMDATLDMLTNLVEWGSILIQKDKPQTQVLDLRKIVQNIVTNLQPFASIKNNTIVNDIEPACIVHSDENSLRFIFRNIISNANKFTSSGIIRLTSERLGANKVKIAITDTGCGMTEDTLKQLFIPGIRNSREGTNKEKGSGLGLILAKEFAEALGIEMEVASTPEVGTTFNLLFQLVS